ncbi:hypothetical protein RFI_15759, partial [Reticulomyxa filosa]
LNNHLQGKESFVLFFKIEPIEKHIQCTFFFIKDQSSVVNPLSISFPSSKKKKDDGNEQMLLLAKMNVVAWSQAATEKLSNEKHLSEEQAEQVRSVFLVMEAFPNMRLVLMKDPKLILSIDFQDKVNKLRDANNIQVVKLPNVVPPGFDSLNPRNTETAVRMEGVLPITARPMKQTTYETELHMRTTLTNARTIGNFENEEGTSGLPSVQEENGREGRGTLFHRKSDTERLFDRQPTQEITPQDPDDDIATAL